MYDKLISLLLCDRYHHIEKVLYDLSQCYDINNYHILMFVEPGFPQTLDLIKKSNIKNTEIIILNKNECGKNLYRVTENMYFLLVYSFGLSDYVIILEDDISPGKDFLNYCEFMRHKHQINDKIFTIHGFSAASSNLRSFIDQYSTEDYTNKYIKFAFFNSWGWATWENRWDLIIKPQWHKILYGTWDCFMDKVFRKNMKCIFPCVARTKNRGYDGVSFNNLLGFTNDWWNEYQRSGMWINDQHHIIENNQYEYHEPNPSMKFGKLL